MDIIFSVTSSKGNCSVIESKDRHLIIIDAGLKYRQVDKEVSYRLHKADALLITHAHKDHTAFLTDFTNCGIDSYLGCKTRSELIVGPCIGLFMPVDEKTKIETHSFLIKPIEMQHTNSDGTPCECFGFLILDKSTGEKMLWATDTQFIKNRFSPLEYYCIESNYFEQDDYNDEIDYITKSVEQRRFQSHMSFESAVKFLKMQDLSKCKEIHLLHLSTKMDDKERKSVVRKMKRALKNELEGKNIKILV